MLSKSQDRHPGTRSLAPINTAGFSITLTGAEGLGEAEEPNRQQKSLLGTLITSSPWLGNAQKMMLSAGIHQDRWMALLVSAQQEWPRLSQLWQHGQRMLNSPLVHQGAAASSCWQERMGKFCIAAACSQSRADASGSCVQQPPPAADLLTWFKHPVLTSNVCCRGGVHHIWFLRAAKWPQVKSGTDSGASLCTRLIQCHRRILAVKTLNSSFVGKGLVSPEVILRWGRTDISFDLVKLCTTFLFQGAS